MRKSDFDSNSLTPPRKSPTPSERARSHWLEWQAQQEEITNNELNNEDEKVAAQRRRFIRYIEEWEKLLADYDNAAEDFVRIGALETERRTLEKILTPETLKACKAERQTQQCAAITSEQRLSQLTELWEQRRRIIEEQRNSEAHVRDLEYRPIAGISTEQQTMLAQAATLQRLLTRSALNGEEQSELRAILPDFQPQELTDSQELTEPLRGRMQLKIQEIRNQPKLMSQRDAIATAQSHADGLYDDLDSINTAFESHVRTLTDELLAAARALADNAASSDSEQHQSILRELVSLGLAVLSANHRWQQELSQQCAKQQELLSAIENEMPPPDWTPSDQSEFDQRIRTLQKRFASLVDDVTNLHGNLDPHYQGELMRQDVLLRAMNRLQQSLRFVLKLHSQMRNASSGEPINSQLDALERQSEEWNATERGLTLTPIRIHPRLAQVDLALRRHDRHQAEDSFMQAITERRALRGEFARLSIAEDNHQISDLTQRFSSNTAALEEARKRHARLVKEVSSWLERVKKEAEKVITEAPGFLENIRTAMELEWGPALETDRETLRQLADLETALYRLMQRDALRRVQEQRARWATTHQTPPSDRGDEVLPQSTRSAILQQAGEYTAQYISATDQLLPIFDEEGPRLEAESDLLKDRLALTDFEEEAQSLMDLIDASEEVMLKAHEAAQRDEDTFSARLNQLEREPSPNEDLNILSRRLESARAMLKTIEGHLSEIRQLRSDLLEDDAHERSSDLDSLGDSRSEIADRWKNDREKWQWEYITLQAASLLYTHESMNIERRLEAFTSLRAQGNHNVLRLASDSNHTRTQLRNLSMLDVDSINEVESSAHQFLSQVESWHRDLPVFFSRFEQAEAALRQEPLTPRLQAAEAELLSLRRQLDAQELMRDASAPAWTTLSTQTNEDLAQIREGLQAEAPLSLDRIVRLENIVERLEREQPDRGRALEEIEDGELERLRDLQIELRSRHDELLQRVQDNLDSLSRMRDLDHSANSGALDGPSEQLARVQADLENIVVPLRRVLERPQLGRIAGAMEEHERTVTRIEVVLGSREAPTNEQGEREAFVPLKAAQLKHFEEAMQAIVKTLEAVDAELRRHRERIDRELSAEIQQTSISVMVRLQRLLELPLSLSVENDDVRNGARHLANVHRRLVDAFQRPWETSGVRNLLNEARQARLPEATLTSSAQSEGQPAQSHLSISDGPANAPANDLQTASNTITQHLTRLTALPLQFFTSNPQLQPWLERLTQVRDDLIEMCRQRPDETAVREVLSTVQEYGTELTPILEPAERERDSQRRNILRLGVDAAQTTVEAWIDRRLRGVEGLTALHTVGDPALNTLETELRHARDILREAASNSAATAATTSVTTSPAKLLHRTKSLATLQPLRKSSASTLAELQARERALCDLLKDAGINNVAALRTAVDGDNVAQPLIALPDRRMIIFSLREDAPSTSNAPAAQTRQRFVAVHESQLIAASRNFDQVAQQIGRPGFMGFRIQPPSVRRRSSSPQSEHGSSTQERPPSPSNGSGDGTRKSSYKRG